MTNPNEPAMPVEARTPFYHNGLTKREYMATKIMAGLCQNANINAENPIASAQIRAKIAAINTNALIRELNKEE